MSKPSGPVQLGNDQVREITKRLDAIIRLLATSLPEKMKQRDKIKLLSESGLQPKEIGPMLGISSNAVSVALFEMRRGEKTQVTEPSPGSSTVAPEGT